MVSLLLFIHLSTSFLAFLLHRTTQLNTLIEEKKEPGGPYRFGKALRALSIFSLFYLVVKGTLSPQILMKIQ